MGVWQDGAMTGLGDGGHGWMFGSQGEEWKSLKGTAEKFGGHDEMTMDGDWRPSTGTGWLDHDLWWYRRGGRL